MIIAIVPLLVAVVGTLVYALAGNAKLAEIGRCLLWVGVLWLMYLFAGKTVRLP